MNNIQSKRNEFINFVKDIIIIVIVVFIIKTFVIIPFMINGQSMADSYYNKEFIIVDRLSYLFGNPKRWDVIVFKPRVDDNKQYFLKRVIWIPGDELKFEKWNVFVKPKRHKDFIQLREAYLNESNTWKTYVKHKTDLVKTYKLWADDYFVIWDNRLHSTDSRECFGNCITRNEFVPKSDIIWKVFIDLGYFDFKKLKFISPELWIDTFPKFFSSPASFDYKELP